MTAAREEPRLIVVGLGNRTRCDDGIGARLLESIESRLPASVAGVVLEGADAFTLAQELIERQKPMLFVDCAQMGAAPGESRCWPEAAARLVANGEGQSTHGFTLGDGIDLARGLGFDQPLYFFGVQPASTEPGRELSRELRDAYESLQQALLSTINTLLVSIDQ